MLRLVKIDFGGKEDNWSETFKPLYCALSFCELTHIIHSKDPYRTPTMPIRPLKTLFTCRSTNQKIGRKSPENCYKPAHKVTSCARQTHYSPAETCPGMTKQIGSLGIWWPVWCNELFITARLASFMNISWGLGRNNFVLGAMTKQRG